jgi:hypothetical protein
MLQRTPAHDIALKTLPQFQEWPGSADCVIVRRNTQIKLSTAEEAEVRRWARSFYLIYGTLALACVALVWIAT